MELQRHFARQFAYDAWANRETSASLRVPAVPSVLVRLMAHIVAARSLWLARIRDEAPRLAVWPELSLEQIETHDADLTRDWQNLLDRLAPEDFARRVAYTNSSGEAWVSTLADVLAHVVLHSSYHRGQIAAGLRGGGHPPAYTDYAHCTRHGFI